MLKTDKNSLPAVPAPGGPHEPIGSTRISSNTNFSKGNYNGSLDPPKSLTG